MALHASMALVESVNVEIAKEAAPVRIGDRTFSTDLQINVNPDSDDPWVVRAPTTSLEAALLDADREVPRPLWRPHRLELRGSDLADAAKEYDRAARRCGLLELELMSRLARKVLTRAVDICAIHIGQASTDLSVHGQIADDLETHRSAQRRQRGLRSEQAGEHDALLLDHLRLRVEKLGLARALMEPEDHIIVTRTGVEIAVAWLGIPEL